MTRLTRKISSMLLDIGKTQKAKLPVEMSRWTTHVIADVGDAFVFCLNCPTLEQVDVEPWIMIILSKEQRGLQPKLPAF